MALGAYTLRLVLKADCHGALEFAWGMCAFLQFSGGMCAFLQSEPGRNLRILFSRSILETLCVCWLLCIAVARSLLECR